MKHHHLLEKLNASTQLRHRDLVTALFVLKKIKPSSTFEAPNLIKYVFQTCIAR